jgi:hypothetical protein
MKSEDRICQEVYQRFHNTFPQFRGLLFHIPNGGARNGREGAKFKTMGVYPGVADYCFLWNGVISWIEVKNEIGIMSQVQMSWKKTIEAQRFDYYLVSSSDEFWNKILELMGR